MSKIIARVGMLSLGLTAGVGQVWRQAAPVSPTSTAAPVASTLNTMGIKPGGKAQVIYTTEGTRFEASNWTKDGASLIFDQGGKMMTVPVKGGEPKAIDVGSLVRCGGSHGLSPDGKWLAVTCTNPDKPGTRVWVVPVGGGEPKVVTENPSSYFHSWSPDGKTIAFTRPANGAGDIYAIPVEGGEEKKLTEGPALSDDPDYSPDGKWIYFNSNRSGVGMQIWRMKTDGSEPEQVTTDEMVNWTPHISPDGKWMVFQSYPKGTTGHPTNTDIAIRLMSLSDRKIVTLANIIGGTGTMNVNSWAPDSKRFGFVSYRLLGSK